MAKIGRKIAMQWVVMYTTCKGKQYIRVWHDYYAALYDAIESVELGDRDILMCDIYGNIVYNENCD
jgi:hypothetical protein